METNIEQLINDLMIRLASHVRSQEYEAVVLLAETIENLTSSYCMLLHVRGIQESKEEWER